MLFMVFTTASLFSAVTATYDAEKNIVFKVKPAPYTSNDVFGAKLGRFTIVSDTGPIYSPVLTNTTPAPGINTSINPVKMQGPMKRYDTDPEYPQGQHDFHIQALTYINGLGSPPRVETLWNSYWPLAGESSVTIPANPLYVDIFLVNHQENNLNPTLTYGPARYFKYDATYTFLNTFNPKFSIAVANLPNIGPGDYMDGTTGGVQNNTNLGSYVTTDGKTGPNTTPILDPNGPTGEGSNGGFIYGDPPAPVSYILTFKDNTVPISLQDGNGVGSDARFEVNEARMTLANTKADNTYSVQIKIKDDSPSPTSLQLLPEQPGPNPINYNLY